MQNKVLVGLIGRGIQKSLSPALHEMEAAHHGIGLHYQLIDLDAAHVESNVLPTLVNAARTMGFAGFNMTYPFKQTILPLLDELSAEAAAVGAVNTVVIRNGKFIGHNTDGSGWAWGFSRALPNADLREVVQLGAGGAGSAVANAALLLGVGKLTLIDQDHQRATALAQRLNTLHSGDRAVAATDVVVALGTASGLIHTTPTGMEKLPGLPLPESLLRKELWVSEIVYLPIDTALLVAARRAGCATADGCWMTVGQAAGAFKLFTGREPDAARMDAHLRRMISEQT
jgi:shikimate dehydrogenase